MKCIASLLLFIIFASECAAAEAYLDDRSLAKSLVRSLYNAINMKQYVRAFTYYATPPASDLETYAHGFAHTSHVDVLSGKVTGDGAAGSVYFRVPTLIRATGDQGTTYFSGCYVVRQINPGAQEPPYIPLQIQSGALKPAHAADFTGRRFPTCGQN